MPKIRRIDMMWEFYEMYMPEDLRPETEKIKEVIEEALNEVGYLFNKEQTNSVTVKFLLPN